VNPPEVETVLAWHDALNAGDVERLMSLSTTEVEVGGPRGTGRGADLLRDWVTRAGIRLEPGRVVSGDGRIVVEQTARWPGADGALGEPQTVASVFAVRDGRVASVIRYADMPSALEAAGLLSAPE
jgi:ketosteroid isomerase-like protein